MDVALTLQLLVGGIFTGAIAAIAGGASFITFPALLATGMSPMSANVTNWVALMPGNFMAVVAYRSELRELAQQGQVVKARMAAAFLGGVAGSVLLFWAGEARFQKAVPWLMLMATLVFALGDWVRRRLQTRQQPAAQPSITLAVTMEFLMMTYGGYFGAGLGIMLIALYTMLGEASLHRANAMKNLMVTTLCISSGSIYLLSGLVAWAYAIPLFAGAILGGYGGIRLARRVPTAIVRQAVMAWAIFLTGYMFWKYG